MSADRDLRAASVSALHDFTEGRGLEIGPLFTPLVERGDGVEVRYVDIVSREDLRAYYEDDPRVPVHELVEVDYWLTGADGVVRSLARTVGHDGPFDWVLASHVVEHVPDLVGWLADVAGVVTEAGVLVLVVPDKRFTFDLQRPLTTVGAVLQAHHDGDTIPSVRAVHDYFHSAVTVNAADLWAGTAPLDPPRIYDDAEAARYVGRQGLAHVDCHVWVFTPDSFLDHIRELRRLGLCDWYVDGFETTPTNRLEFFVRLRRTTGDGRIFDEVMSDATADPAITTTDDVAADLAAQVQQLTARVARVRRRERRLRRRLAEIESSRRWRMATGATRPIDSVRRVVGKLRKQLV